MVNCPKCGSEQCVKDGIVKGKQRYRCKLCNFRHTVQHRQHRGKSSAVKRQALELYLEGLGFRSIGRILHCSHVSVYNWIKSYGEKIEKLRSGSTLEIIEMDELHTYIGSKKNTVGYGLLLIDMKNDSSTACLAIAAQQQAKNCGTISKAKK